MTSGPVTVSVLAPAKVNLFLHVVGRREDGYHLLDSLVVFAGTGDRLDLRPADDLSLDITGPGAAVPGLADDNIVLRAARRLAEAAGIAPRAAITLDKRLPVAAGVGGGSADAAATLRGLVRLWGLAVPEPDLAALGLALGADVPVCLRGQPTAVSGIGEHLASVPPLPPAWLVLVNPGRPLATPAVFRARAASGAPFSAAAPLTTSPVDAAALAAALDERRNDLTAAARALEPAVGEVLDRLERLDGCLLARMSGSGATCFGLFADETTARAAEATLTAARPDWWTVAAALVHSLSPSRGRGSGRGGGAT
ncbi:MAG: 4-(cytidine 5'-diphospho)-2-C-methyl-D-erythritol kinase [Alphaproteobacteria bacterium]